MYNGNSLAQWDLAAEFVTEAVHQIVRQPFVRLELLAALHASWNLGPVYATKSIVQVISYACHEVHERKLHFGVPYSFMNILKFTCL